jgi:WS/DGAT/MGAT family acyltransferase
MIAALARILFRSPDPPTILKGPLGRAKKAVGSEPFSLPEIKKIAQYKQATINDVLMAVASGAIRRYMDLHGDHRELIIRAFIMVNLRGHTLDEELGNKFGLVFLNLPINREQPLERLEAVKHGMDRLKASAEYAVTYIILNVLGFMPEWIEHLATRFLDTKGTVVATNVPGPRKLLYMADAPIQSIIGWVPQSGRIGVGLSIISYNNQIVVGLNVDAGLIPDPDKFLELFTEEYKSLQAAVAANTLDT